MNGEGNVVERNPVMIWPIVGAFVGSVLSRFLPSLGTELIDSTVQLVVTLGPILVGLWYTRTRVTPVKYPRTPEGQPAQLVPKQ